MYSYSVEENPLENFNFPNNNFDHYRFVRWVEAELTEHNKWIENPEAAAAEEALRRH